MLQEIHIENLAIIERITLEFDTGLNVITGETGAGKSLLLNAVQLVLGDRGGSDKIRPQENELFVSVRFIPLDEARKILVNLDFPVDEVIVSRKISRTGRSRFWINNKPVTAEIVKEIGKYLVDIHGQHSHQLLFDSNHHLSILDDFAGIVSLRKQFEESFRSWHEISNRLERLIIRRDEIFRQQRLEMFELQELHEAQLFESDEETKLEKQLDLIEDAEEIIDFAGRLEYDIVEKENSVSDIVGKFKQEAERFAILDEIGGIIEYLETILASIEEIQAITGGLKSLEYDPKHAGQIRERLSLLGDLQRKFKKNLPELIRYRDELNKKKIEDKNIDEQIEKLEKEVESARNEVENFARELSTRRHSAAFRLSEAVEKELIPLGFQDAKFRMQLEITADEKSPFLLGDVPTKLFSSGFEKAEFVFSANPGLLPKPLRKIVSGGELSRLALAIKVILPTSDLAGCSLFDEIDAGVGGGTAIKVAERLEKLAESKQIIVITHLHPVARKANRHINIEKLTDGASTEVNTRVLSKSEIEKELKRMMSLEVSQE